MLCCNQTPTPVECSRMFAGISEAFHASSKAKCVKIPCLWRDLTQ